jgi:hypothetical protein
VLNRLLAAIKLNFTLMGAAVGLMLRPLVEMVDLFGLADKLIDAKQGTRGDILSKFFSSKKGEYEKMFGDLSSAVVGQGKEIISGKAPKEVLPPQKDAFISKDGRVTPILDSDNVMAFQGAMPSRGGSNINVTLGNVNVTVTEGNARKAGENFANGVNDQLSKMLRNMLYRQGELRGAF